MPEAAVGRNRPCPCGSGRRYKACCGATGTGPATITQTGTPPPGLLLVAGFVGAQRCAELRRLADQQPGRDASVMDVDNDERVVETRSAHRVTTHIDIQAIAREIIPLVGRAYTDFVAPHFGVETEWFEYPTVLRYGPGGRYDEHADADNRDDATGEWERKIDRDYSILIYLNDDFTGGAISFPNFDYQLQPCTGLLVAFPSDHRYVHAALPLETGTRYVIVSWAAAVGTERVSEARPFGVVYMDSKYDPSVTKPAS